MLLYPECGMDEGEPEQVEQEKKKGKKAGGKAKAVKGGKRAAKKKRLASGASSAEDPDGSVPGEPEGPLHMNLFALGFEETEAKAVVVKKSMTQTERLEMKVRLLRLKCCINGIYPTLLPGEHRQGQRQLPEDRPEEEVLCQGEELRREAEQVIIV